jgi:NAD(P)-dependent dehydrogenase (short-subunit alcohol dehydrogenase family)
MTEPAVRHPFDLNGTVALVVGGRGFLGRRFCAALQTAGASVCAADRPQLSRPAAQDEGVPISDARQFDVDAADPSSVDALVDAVISAHGRIDTLVFSVTTKPDDFYAAYTACSLAGWQEILHAELDGAFVVTQRVGARMERTGGSMILLSSIYGVVGNDQRIYEGANLAEAFGAGSQVQPSRIYSHAGYAAAKGGLISLTRYLAAYWGEAGIRVNCISPGGVSHPSENAAFVRRYSERVPLGRKAAPDEVSGAVVYLASPAASYVTGHNLIVDGGWTAW